MRARSLAHCARRWPCPGASFAIVGHTLADQLRAMAAGRWATLDAAAASRGRTLVDRCARWSRRLAQTLHNLPPPSHATGRRWAFSSATMAGMECDACGALVARDARWPRDVALDVVRCRRDFRGGGAADRPPLRRVSGNVVTAGLNSSRVWFGPVPGSP
ncbi:hypothetical protein F511_46053 [Dorcoceras hygrometricum]|uniref:Uncharacterized protein n=1 Tax=Dorcoceras hygrometricum TaxID=472368 RepID=A0A2Z7A1H1_9LAMI|nr:hypothetical protein F511_46053 [Dorcoceras hygrometricum]